MAPVRALTTLGAKARSLLRLWPFAVVILGVSLLITVLNQFVATLLGLRGTNLRWGLETLLKRIETTLGDRMAAIEAFIPYRRNDLVALWRQRGVVDEDLGVTGSIPRFRQGFELLLRRMEAGQVGVVGVLDINRLIRNEVDLVNFSQTARAHDVLLVHGAQIVDFSDPNSSVFF